MTTDKALYQYFSTFMKAFPATTEIAQTETLPWLTYEYASGKFGDGAYSITANMWYKTNSEAVINAKADDFRTYIDNNELIKCDDGYMWVKAGTPFCTAVATDDKSIKRRYFNIEIEFWR